MSGQGVSGVDEMWIISWVHLCPKPWSTHVLLVITSHVALRPARWRLGSQTLQKIVI